MLGAQKGREGPTHMSQAIPSSLKGSLRPQPGDRTPSLIQAEGVKGDRSSMLAEHF